MTDLPEALPAPRHLRLLPPPPVTYAQIPDFPEAYAVRRGGPAEAIMHRANGGAGDWLLMYRHVPDAPEGAEQWLGSAVLSSKLTEQQAAAAAIELIEACEVLDVAPSWPELLGRLIDAGVTVADLGRLHSPDRLGFCQGDNLDTDDRRPWITCATVRLLAASVGVELLDVQPPECYQPNGFRAPEVDVEMSAECAARHPGRPCDPPS